MVWDCGKPSEKIGKSFAQDPALLWGMRGRSKFGRICGVKDQALKDAFPKTYLDWRSIRTNGYVMLGKRKERWEAEILCSQEALMIGKWKR